MLLTHTNNLISDRHTHIQFYIYRYRCICIFEVRFLFKIFWNELNLQIRRLRQLEAERDMLYQGLDVVERARVWYKQQLQSIFDRIQYLPQGSNDPVSIFNFHMIVIFSNNFFIILQVQTYHNQLN